jgi:hypothetical protein
MATKTCDYQFGCDKVYIRQLEKQFLDIGDRRHQKQYNILHLSNYIVVQDHHILYIYDELTGDGIKLIKEVIIENLEYKSIIPWSNNMMIGRIVDKTHDIVQWKVMQVVAGGDVNCYDLIGLDDDSTISHYIGSCVFQLEQCISDGKGKYTYNTLLAKLNKAIVDEKDTVFYFNDSEQVYEDLSNITRVVQTKSGEAIAYINNGRLHISRGFCCTTNRFHNEDSIPKDRLFNDRFGAPHTDVVQDIMGMKIFAAIKTHKYETFVIAEYAHTAVVTNLTKSQFNGVETLICSVTNHNLKHHRPRLAKFKVINTQEYTAQYNAQTFKLLNTINSITDIVALDTNYCISDIDKDHIPAIHELCSSTVNFIRCYDRQFVYFGSELGKLYILGDRSVVKDAVEIPSIIELRFTMS